MAEESFSKVCKCWTTIFTVIWMTTLFTCSKVSFISLSMLLAEAKSKAENSEQFQEYAGLHAVIYLVIVIPYAITAVRAFVNARSSEPLMWRRECKSSTILFLATLAHSILEPIGLFILAFELLPRIDPLLGLHIMSSVVTTGAVPLIIQRYREQERLQILIYLISTISLLACILIELIFHRPNVLEGLIFFSICYPALFIAWQPLLQRCLVKSETPRAKSTENGQVEVAYEEELSWWMLFMIFIIKIIVLTTCVLVAIEYHRDHVDYLSFLQVAWNLGSTITNDNIWISFGVNLAAGFIGYFMTVFVFQSNMHFWCFAVPIGGSIFVSIALFLWKFMCELVMDTASACRSRALYDSLLFALCMPAISISIFVFLTRYMKEDIDLKRERKIFWIPSYNGAILDSWLLLNRRRLLLYQGNQSDDTDKRNSRKSKIYICTTMYREDKKEIKNLLQSLKKVTPQSEENDKTIKTGQQSQPQENGQNKEGKIIEYESHIIVDGGIQNNTISECALTLISLLPSTLEINLGMECKLYDTAFGRVLRWEKTDKHLALHIYLKDSSKVKNKKRWSQVMYMSYILNFLNKDNNCDDTFILATDADVSFSAESVESLLRLMIRNSSVGAVCGRTIPVGSGPLVWYQEFEYAVGHWFQKTAEHVLGSVLCAPGCFSLYRCSSLKQILSKYSTTVGKAFDFLTKDMGEDRWMCTLLLEVGNKIEYCAASTNKTHCPDNFEEFFKQRRRWQASTLANMFLILKQWNKMQRENKNFNLIFKLYQGLQLFATLIAPSMVILIVSGGLHFAWEINEITTTCLQAVFIIVFAVICLYTTSDFQLKVAKLYTFLYAAIMCAVIVGTIEQLVRDIYDDEDDNEIVFSVFNTSNNLHTTKRPDHHISDDVPISLTTMYLFTMIGMYLTGGILHLSDIFVVCHGLWYLLCLPSAFLILPTYSICNLTDSSWGTREESRSLTLTKVDELKNFSNWLFDNICRCCRPRTETTGPDVVQKANTDVLLECGLDTIPQTYQTSTGQNNFISVSEIKTKAEKRERAESATVSDELPEFCHHVQPIHEWLPSSILRDYEKNFVDNGFENTLLMKGITENELYKIGVTKKGHVFYILNEAKKLPRFDIAHKIPDDVDEWLDEIGLPMYKENFKRNKIDSKDSIVILKDFDRKAIEDELEIKLNGHIKRLLYAIQILRETTAVSIQSVEEWLPQDMCSQYGLTFTDNGFENTLLIKGITEDELITIGVRKRGHVDSILAMANSLPSFELDFDIPNNVNNWLDKIGLSQYKTNFESTDSLLHLKRFDKKAIQDKLKIFKYGHIKRLLYAISRIGQPTGETMKINEVKSEFDGKTPKNLESDEEVFWESTVDNVLHVPQKAFGYNDHINAKLLLLRNQWLLMFAITNTLWLIGISTTANKWILLFKGENPFGLIFVLIFGLLLSIQFLTMLYHRMLTICNYLVMTPCKCVCPLPWCFSLEDGTKETTNKPIEENNQSDDTPCSSNPSNQNEVAKENLGLKTSAESGATQSHSAQIVPNDLESQSTSMKEPREQKEKYEKGKKSGDKKKKSAPISGKVNNTSDEEVETIECLSLNSEKTPLMSEEVDMYTIERDGFFKGKKFEDVEKKKKKLKK